MVQTQLLSQEDLLFQTSFHICRFCCSIQLSGHPHLELWLCPGCSFFQNHTSQNSFLAEAKYSGSEIFINQTNGPSISPLRVCGSHKNHLLTTAPVPNVIPKGMGGGKYGELGSDLVNQSSSRHFHGPTLPKSTQSNDKPILYRPSWKCQALSHEERVGQKADNALRHKGAY